MPPIIGKIVKANAHTDYVCQVYGPGEVEVPPSREDYALGTFVRVALDTAATTWLVGLIYDTVLYNPDFGRLGPRLSAPPDLAVFSPDYLNEKAVLVGINAIGLIQPDQQVNQAVPRLAAMTDSLVERMPESHIRLFHGDADALWLAYIARLLALNSPLALDLVQMVLTQLWVLFPQTRCRQILGQLLDYLQWQRQITPFAGHP